MTNFAAPATDLLFDPDVAPTEETLSEMLGASRHDLQFMLRRLQVENSSVSAHWEFSAQSGWYCYYTLKRRRLFYLFPRPRGFRLAVMLEDAAVGVLRHSCHLEDIPTVIAGGRKYPEGTLFSFESSHFDPEVVLALLFAKLRG